MRAVKLSQTLAGNHPRARRTVAVLGFKDVGQAQAAWLSTALAEMFTSEIAAGEQLRIIPQESVASRKRDLGFSDTESFDSEQLHQLRKVLDSDVAVLGSYSDSQGQIRLDLRAQDTNTQEIVASVAETGTESKLRDLVLRTGMKLRQRLGVADLTPTEEQAVVASFPATSEAMQLYSEGLAQLRLLNAATARGLLVKAVTADPRHALSHSALSLAWSLFGYDGKASEEARRAFELCSSLSREHQLLIEGHYRELAREKDKAIEIYRTLFSLFPDNLDYGLLLADALSHNGKGKDARNTLKALRTLRGPGEEDPRTDLAEVWAARSLGDYPRETTAAAAAIRAAQAVGARSLLAQAEVAQGVSFRHSYKFENAIASFESGRKLYAELGDLRGVGSALNGLGNSLYQKGDLNSARTAFSDALTAYEKVDAKSDAAGVLGNLANVIGDQGDLEGAAKLYQRQLTIARDTEDRRSIGESLNNLGTISVLWGDLAKGIEDFQQCLAIFRDVGDQYYAATSLDSIGTARLLQGQLAEAKRAFENERQLRSQAGDDDGLAYPLEGLGEALSAGGELEQAKRNLNNSLAISRRTGEKHVIAQALSALGSIALQQADLTTSRKNYEEAFGIRNQIGERYSIVDTELGLAELSLEEGKPAEAEAHARKALKEANSEKLRDDQTASHAILAELFFQQKKSGDRRKEISIASRMARTSQNPGIRLRTLLVAAHGDLKSANTTRASSTVRAALAEAQQHHLKSYEYEARLSLAKLELKSAQRQVARSHLQDLLKEAQDGGFQSIANRAASTLKSLGESRQ